MRHTSKLHFLLGKNNLSTLISINIIDNSSTVENKDVFHSSVRRITFKTNVHLPTYVCNYKTQKKVSLDLRYLKQETPDTDKRDCNHKAAKTQCFKFISVDHII